MSNSPNQSGSQPPLDPAPLMLSMERILANQGPDQDSDQHAAQDFVFEAMRATCHDDYTLALGRAIALDPMNADALRMVLDGADVDLEERIRTLEFIVTSEAKRLGEKEFFEMQPHFWSFLETRPYMRARHQLALALQADDQLERATTEFEEMLRLNENDNQALRYGLLPLYLIQSRLDEARELQARFEDEHEFSVVFAWCLVLERWLSKDQAGCERALEAAQEQNRHLKIFIKGHRKLPTRQPNSYSPGSLEEAHCFAELLLVTWKAQPEAWAWLRG